MSDDINRVPAGIVKQIHAPNHSVVAATLAPGVVSVTSRRDTLYVYSRVLRMKQANLSGAVALIAITVSTWGCVGPFFRTFRVALRQRGSGTTRWCLRPWVASRDRAR
jgi:hypothetical protein